MVNGISEPGRVPAGNPLISHKIVSLAGTARVLDLGEDPV